MLVDIVQKTPDLIMPTSPVIFARLDVLIQRTPELIKPTVFFARLDDIVPRTPDLIKPTSPVISPRLVDTTRPYKVQKYGNFRKAG
jgi:hypothetical protein